MSDFTFLVRFYFLSFLCLIIDIHLLVCFLLLHRLMNGGKVHLKSKILEFVFTMNPFCDNFLSKPLSKGLSLLLRIQCATKKRALQNQANFPCKIVFFRYSLISSRNCCSLIYSFKFFIQPNQLEH